MDKLYKWISKHKIIAFILYNSICWMSFLLLSAVIEIHLVWWFVFGLFILLISTMFVSSADRYTLNKAIKVLNEQCDPNPFLETVEQQLSRVKSKSYRQLLLINKAAALRELGRFDEAISILSSMNIDQYSTTGPLVKILYYNNLTDILIIKGEFSQAKTWHSKMIQMLHDVKAKEKYKKLLNETSISNQAELLVADNNLAEAENMLNGLPESISNRQRISKSLLYARILIKQNKPNEAKQCLQFVVDHGNRLYDAVQARAILNSL